MKDHQNKLQGLRVLNTRPWEQGQNLSAAIAHAGGLSIDVPAIAIEPTTDDWISALPKLALVDQVIFISANAVNYFYKALEQSQLPWSNTIQTTTIGHASAKALEHWGIAACHIPLIADSEHLLQLDVFQEVKHQTILLIKGEGGRMNIAHTLINRGANLVSLTVYRRCLPQNAAHDLRAVWHDDRVDVILFTSQEAIQNLFLLLGVDAHAWLRQMPCLVISHRLAEVAAQFGMQKVIVSRYDAILDALEHYKKG